MARHAERDRPRRPDRPWLTAPDNGLGHFSQAAVATTRADGTWRAHVPAGPSRLVEGAYDGAPTLEPSMSGQVHVIVPAKVKLLSVWPSRVPWGGTVRITGQLIGGYLPPSGALVRLRIGHGPSYQTYGVQEHVTGNGRFTTTYTFGAGYAGIFKSFWFQIASLPVSDYPYAPAASGRRSVLVGGHPRVHGGDSPAPPETQAQTPGQPPQAMIARIRGEHDRRWGRWRPAARDAGAAPASGSRGPKPQPQALPKRRSVWAFLVAGAAIAVACVAAARWLSPAPAPPQLPATPRAWLDASEAAAIDNPSRCARSCSRRSSLRPTGRRFIQAARATSNGSRASRWSFAGLHGRDHGGTRAAPDGAAPRLGGCDEPSGRRLASGRSSRRQRRAVRRPLSPARRLLSRR